MHRVLSLGQVGPSPGRPVSPDEAPAIVNADAVNRLLGILSRPQTFNPAQALNQNQPALLDGGWRDLVEGAREVIRRLGRTDDDPALRGAVLWALNLAATQPGAVVSAVAAGGSSPASARPYFLVLDEMNLARVEYYFADFLSVMESGRQIDGPDRGLSRGVMHLHQAGEYAQDEGGAMVPSELRLPPNLYVVGTVNMDETPFAFSPKILDRAFTLKFGSIDLEGYLQESGAGTAEEPPMSDPLRVAFTRGGRFANIDKGDLRRMAGNIPEVMDDLRGLNGRLEGSRLQFGFRVVDEILAFIGSAATVEEFSHPESGLSALDGAVLMKVLSKFHGPRHRLEPALLSVLRWAGGQEEDGAFTTDSAHYPLVAAKVAQMLRSVREDGHATFA